MVDEVTGKDYRWFFDQTWFSAELCDYAVTVKNERARPLAGYADGPGGQPTLVPPRADSDRRSEILLHYPSPLALAYSRVWRDRDPGAAPDGHG